MSKFERIVSAGEANTSISGFNVSCPSLVLYNAYSQLLGDACIHSCCFCAWSEKHWHTWTQEVL